MSPIDINNLIYLFLYPYVLTVIQGNINKMLYSNIPFVDMASVAKIVYKFNGEDEDVIRWITSTEVFTTIFNLPEETIKHLLFFRLKDKALIWAIEYSKRHLSYKLKDFLDGLNKRFTDIAAELKKTGRNL